MMEFMDFCGNKAKVTVDDEGLVNIHITLGRQLPEGVDIEAVLATIGYLPMKKRPVLKVVK